MIHPMPALSSTGQIPLGAGQSAPLREEYFVIDNPPQQKTAFLQLVQQYNAAHPAPADGFTTRLFYRASKDFGPDYKESNNGYFDKERIGNHIDELLLVVKFDHGQAQYLPQTQNKAYQELFGAAN